MLDFSAQLYYALLPSDCAGGLAEGSLASGTSSPASAPGKTAKTVSSKAKLTTGENILNASRLSHLHHPPIPLYLSLSLPSHRVPAVSQIHSEYKSTLCHGRKLSSVCSSAVANHQIPLRRCPLNSEAALIAPSCPPNSARGSRTS